jgi:hypothetical protein
MIHSHLAYCINIYGCASATVLNKLIVKQKEAIRVVSLANYRDHTVPLFKKLNILPLNELIMYSALKFMHKYKHNRLPFSFNEIWTTNRARNPDVILRNADNFYVPAHNFATIKKHPYFYFPKIWNEDRNDKLNPSHKQYLKCVKSALLNSLVA